MKKGDMVVVVSTFCESMTRFIGHTSIVKSVEEGEAECILCSHIEKGTFALLENDEYHRVIDLQVINPPPLALPAPSREKELTS